MTTLLNQALVLTIVGMGMTFAALGLLALGMYAMTAFITDKPRGKKASAQTRTEEAQTEEALVTRVADGAPPLDAAASLPGTEAAAGRPRDEDRERAAATAVALALEGDTPLAAADDRYRAAAAAVAMAMANADTAPAPANVSSMPDAWNHHAREQRLTQRQRFART